MLRVAILFGGRSGEHEVSLVSAGAVLRALAPAGFEPVPIGIDPEGRWHLQDASALRAGTGPLTVDTGAPEVALVPGGGGRLVVLGAGTAPAPVDVVFPVLHGTFGEDGTVQGLLEMAGVPYVGSGVLGASVAMDKEVAKRLLRDAGLPVVPFLTVRGSRRGRPMDVAAQVRRLLGFPCFVKPAGLGSSVGVHKVRTPDQLHAAVDDALRYDPKVLIERAVDAREIECSVLGNEAPKASVPGEIVPHADFYTYEAKYLDEDGASLAIPADLTAEQTRRVQELSVRVYQTLELAGMARIDFLMDRSSGQLFVNEANTIPGFTPISMYPKLWEATGLPFADLLARLIDLALERHRTRQALVFSHGDAANG